MTMITRGKALACSFGLAMTLGTAGEALASGFQLREQSSEGLGNAFAGSTAKAYNLSTIYYNPAGMTLLNGDQTAGSLTWIAPSSKFSGSNKVGAASTSGSMGGDAIKDAAVGATYAMWDYRPDLKFGIAVTAPFGLRTDYDEDWVGRYHALKSEVTNINVSPSVAYRVNNALSVGGGVQIGYVKARLTQAINLGAYGDGQGELHGEDIGYGWDLGALYEFSPTTRMGLNWRSQMSYKLEGEATFAKPAALSSLASLRNSLATADLTTPDTVSLGLYHEITPQWTVMSDVAWTKWSTFDELRIKYADGRADNVTSENWHDTWFFSVGATYKMDDKNKFHFGLAYDQAPMDDADRTARIPDTDRYWLAVGYTYDVTPNFQANVGYTHIFADKASINETSSTASAGTLTGDYTGRVDIISTSFVMKF